MFEMRESRLDRQDQLEYLVNWGIPDAYKSLEKIDKDFNRLQEEYKTNRARALQHIKDMNSLENKLCNSI